MKALRDDATHGSADAPRVRAVRCGQALALWRTSAGRGVEGAAECPSGDAQLGGDGGSGLFGSEQDAGVGDLVGGQGARTAADAMSLRRTAHRSNATTPHHHRCAAEFENLVTLRIPEDHDRTDGVVSTFPGLRVVVDAVQSPRGTACGWSPCGVRSRGMKDISFHKDGGTAGDRRGRSTDDGRTTGHSTGPDPGDY